VTVTAVVDADSRLTPEMQAICVRALRARSVAGWDSESGGVYFCSECGRKGMGKEDVVGFVVEEW